MGEPNYGEMALCETCVHWRSSSFTNQKTMKICHCILDTGKRNGADWLKGTCPSWTDREVRRQIQEEYGEEQAYD